MQNSNGIAANEGTALRELSLDEAEMVGGGFSWGGLVHGVEHVAEAGAAIVATAATSTFTAIQVTARMAAKDVSKPEPKSDPFNFGDGGGFDWFGDV
jgi:hypothetical protein